MTGLNNSFRVLPYSADNLRKILAEKSHKNNGSVVHKDHVEYLDEYLRQIGAETIVLEERYIDRDFLEDTAAYYVRCFTSYERVCARIHFFSYKFTGRHFRSILSGRTRPAKLQEKYLGFSVIKPLPYTIIGRTCLVTYSDTPVRKRFFPTVQKECVNLFGIDLKVDALPFQEQDQDVAACASSALWSAFHGTGRRFQHAIPSPVEITKAATAHSRIDDRALPAGNGLTTLQMADAIRSVGLEPYAIASKKSDNLCIAAAAYLRAGIPCILLTALEHELPGKSPKLLGHHAVTITGFSFGSGSPIPTGKSGCLIKATTVDRLYCHDDQVGPYAKLRFLPTGKIGTSYIDEQGLADTTFASPTSLAVPLYHKIRIPFWDVFKSLQQVDAWLEAVRRLGYVNLPERVVWDFYLTDVNQFKRGMFAKLPTGQDRLDILSRSYPRYLWILSASCQGQELFDIVLDATDLLQGEHFVQGVPYDVGACLDIGEEYLAYKATLPTKVLAGVESLVSWMAQI